MNTERMKCLTTPSASKGCTGDTGGWLQPHCERWLKMIRFIGCLCLVSLVGIAYVSYQLCSSSSCLAPERFRLTQSQFRFSPQLKQAAPFPVVSKIETVPFDKIQAGTRFNIIGRDVIVFLHIQKTGGTTFGRHLVKDMSLEEPCICPRKRKRCDCFRPNTVDEQWLFSRYSTGWKCGLHADWTEVRVKFF